MNLHQMRCAITTNKNRTKDGAKQKATLVDPNCVRQNVTRVHLDARRASRSVLSLRRHLAGGERERSLSEDLQQILWKSVISPNPNEGGNEEACRKCVRHTMTRSQHKAECECQERRRTTHRVCLCSASTARVFFCVKFELHSAWCHAFSRSCAPEPWPFPWGRLLLLGSHRHPVATLGGCHRPVWTSHLRRGWPFTPEHRPQRSAFLLARQGETGTCTHKETVAVAGSHQKVFVRPASDLFRACLSLCVETLQNLTLASLDGLPRWQMHRELKPGQDIWTHVAVTTP